MEESSPCTKQEQQAIWDEIERFDWSPSDMGKQYDEIGAEKYEAMMDLVKFNEMEEICQEVIAMDVDKDNFEVIDIGAGSGRVGRQIKKAGYQNIDAVDASQGLLEHAKASGAYRNLSQTFLGNGTYPFEEHRDHYDLCVSSGVWLAGHIPAHGMDELVQCIKPGGKWVTAMRTIYYEHGHSEGYRERLEQLQDEGKITLVKQKVFERGVPETKQKLWQPCKSILLVFERCQE